MTLEGITDHTAMRDFLYSRMRGARNQHNIGPAAGPADSLAQVLTEVVGELRAIRQVLERRNA
jgi:hypothetical protein